MTNGAGERLPLVGSKSHESLLSATSNGSKKVAVAAVMIVLIALGVVSTGTTKSLTLSTKQPFCDSTAQSSGYIKLPNKEDGHYFYWFFESRSDPENDPLVLWLTGGPGGSSMLALLTENGPCTVADDSVTTVSNPYSWTNNANVIWVDQPIGTGFSYGSVADADHDSKQAGTNMYYFLQAFLKAHPKFIKNKFFVTGESYAGHYVPTVATALLNTKPSGDDVKINLEGIAIGNGFTNPLIQTKYQADLIQNNSYGIVLMNDTDFAEYKQNVSTLLALTEKCYANDNDACTQASAFWLAGVVMPIVTVAKVSQYDLRAPTGRNEGAVQNQPALKKGGAKGALSDEAMKNIGNSQAHAFLNNIDIQTELHIPAVKRPYPWTELSQAVFANFMPDVFKNYESHVVDLLEHDIRVLIYAGDADLVCNWLGNHAWTNDLEWSGKTDFQAAQYVPFIVNGTDAGALQAAKNFAFLRVYNAGHMVPENQPEVALTMLNRFLADELVRA
ncbi:unnamed protein product [Aphanomyces euteiches]